MAKKEVKTNKEKKHFWKEFKAELKKVIWPTPKQLLNNTAVVVALVLITAVIVFVLDICFDSINKYGITNLQSTVKNSITANKNSEDEKATEENAETNKEETSTENQQQAEQPEEESNTENNTDSQPAESE